MKTKMLIATLGFILITGCASNSTPEEDTVKITNPVEEVNVVESSPSAQPAVLSNRAAQRFSISNAIKDCALDFMDSQAHVLDATSACLKIYRDNPQAQRTQSLN